MPQSPSAVPRALEPQQPADAPRSLRARILGQLDSLLSEPLRRADSASLTRARVLAGTTSLLLLACVLYILCIELAPEPWNQSAPSVGALLGLFSTWVLLRRVRSPLLPALLLCATLSAASVATMLFYRNAYAGTHAVTMIVPALAVYLLGPRLGFLVTILQIVLLGMAVLLLQFHFGIQSPPSDPHILWAVYIAAAACVLGIWVLGTLHSTTRDAALATLEQTLMELRDSERKLSSLFENTDDMVCSMDTEGRLLIANTAMRRTFVRRFGKEPVQGESFLQSVEGQNRDIWAEQLRQAQQGQSTKFEVAYEQDGKRFVLETSTGPILDEAGRPLGMTLFARDVTARREAEARLGEMHRTLVDVSRQAGMAEIASGVLHNVGNALNSVNTSAHLVTDRVRKLRVSGLAQAWELLEANSSNLGAFFAEDPRGQHFPAYLQALAQQMRGEQEAVLKELNSLNESVEHIKAIVSMQQKHARTVGAVEQLWVPQLIDEALRLHGASFERLSITIEREYDDVPSIVTDRHKLLQILMNLMNNARQALVASDCQDKRMSLRVAPTAGGQSLLIEVSDNGMGIAPEHLSRIFGQGFTTKKDGHGFGLHISALAAAEMKGRLTCSSSGRGQGATFTLELPLTEEKTSA